MKPLLVLCTCPDRSSAESIARSLVEHRLAACVNLVDGVTSVYRWNEAIETSNEVQLIIKTHTSRFEELKIHLLMLHPYELPEIIAVDIASGLDRYLDWLTAATQLPSNLS